MKKGRQGISLIVLIVTIIVIIILAAAVILTLSKNNPIESAREAKFKEDIRRFQDELSLAIAKEYTNAGGQRNTNISVTGYDDIKVYIPSFTKEYEDFLEIKNDKLICNDDELPENEDKWLKELNVITIVTMPSSWKNSISSLTEEKVPIPKGFTYVTGDKSSGVVIKDILNDNEFVWVPVEASNYVVDVTFSAISGMGNSFFEDNLPSGISSDSQDVEKYKGFYIARYEAGIPTDDEFGSNKEGIPVSKKGAIAWTNINYTNAKRSAENMISTEYVTTGLLSGAAWDSACHWMGEVVDLSDSRSYGNYKDSIYPANVEGYGSFTTCGYSDAWSVKNIYDMAGNCFEWTKQRNSWTGQYITRGGNYKAQDVGKIGLRSSSQINAAYDDLGFRVRLYIK